MRVCTNCHIDKQESEYYSNGKGGLRSQCKECEKARLRKRYAEVDRYKYRLKYEPVKPIGLVCEFCCNDFMGRKGKKYCSSECRNKQKERQKPYISYKCKGCGKNCTTQNRANTHYCTHECYSKNSPHYKEREFNKECATCGNEFVSNGNGAMYCSDVCDIHKPKMSPVYFKNCKQCDALFTTRYESKVFCSNKCSGVYYGKIKQIVYWAKHSDLICFVCGGSFRPEYRKSKKFCSSECREKRARQVRSRSYSGKDHVLRAKKHGVYYETVGKFNVFSRDNYTCQCCGIKTPKKLAKTNGNEDNEPTIDHIIPISAGGPHAYSNVQTLCRSCNNKKSNSTGGQLGILFETTHPPL